MGVIAFSSTTLLFPKAQRGCPVSPFLRETQPQCPRTYPRIRVCSRESLGGSSPVPHCSVLTVLTVLTALGSRVPAAGLAVSCRVEIGAASNVSTILFVRNASGFCGRLSTDRSARKSSGEAIFAGSTGDNMSSRVRPARRPQIPTAPARAREPASLARLHPGIRFATPIVAKSRGVLR